MVELAAALDDIARRFQWIATVAVVLMLGYMVVLAFDRDPPFRMIQPIEQTVERGQDVVLAAIVERMTHRNCEASFTRYLLAADGAVYHLGTNHASQEMIAELHRRAPGMLRSTFTVPANMAQGEAVLQTVLAYRCNKLHALWPINVTIMQPFTVQ